MDDDAHTASLLSDLRAICAKLRDEFASSSARLTYLLDAVARPDLGELRGELTYQVEQWNGEMLVRVLAACGNLTIASRAFDAAVQEYPDHRWLLCDRARIIREHVPAKLRL